MKMFKDVGLSSRKDKSKAYVYFSPKTDKHFFFFLGINFPFTPRKHKATTEVIWGSDLLVIHYSDSGIKNEISPTKKHLAVTII